MNSVKVLCFEKLSVGLYAWRTPSNFLVAVKFGRIDLFMVFVAEMTQSLLKVGSCCSVGSTFRLELKLLGHLVVGSVMTLLLKQHSWLMFSTGLLIR